MDTLAARFFANDKLVAFVHVGPRVEVLDVATGKLRDSWTVDANRQKQLDALGEGFEAWQVALSPSGELMAWLAVSQKGDGSGVLVYETASGKLLHTIKGLPYTTALDMPDEGKSLVLHPVPAKPGDKNPPRFTVVGVPDGRAKYHCEYRGVPPCTTRRSCTTAGILKKPDLRGRQFAITIHRDVLHLRDREGVTRWDFATGKKLDSWDQEFGQFSVSADGKRMLVRAGTAPRVVDGDTDAIRTNTHFWNVPSIRYQPDGKLRGEAGGRVHVWDPRNEHDAVIARADAEDRTARSSRTSKGSRRRRNYPTARRSTDGKRVIIGREGRRATFSCGGSTTRRGRNWAATASRRASGSATYGLHARWFDDEGTVFGYLTADSRLVRVECATGKVLPPIGGRSLDEALTDDGIPAWQYSAGRAAVHPRDANH